MTPVETTTPDAGEYYYDEDNETLYVRLFESGDPNVTQTIVTYELYTATFDAHWYRDPLDSSSREVYYEPIIKQSPQIKSVVGDLLFGYLPIQTTDLVLINAEHELEDHIFESSFSKCEVLLYHWLGDLSDENIKLVMNGVGSDISYDSSTVKISIRDRIDKFENEWRNETTSFFSEDDFPSIDPNFVGKAIRYVFGRVEGFVPVNIDFNDESPTTSDNRNFVVMNEQNGLSEITRTVPASPSSTTTRTYLNFTQGINVGDSVKIDGGTDYYVKVTNVVDSPTPYIEHEAIGAPANTGDIVRRGFVSLVTIIQQGVKYEALYGRDYTIDLSQAGGCSGFVFSSSLESNLSMPQTLSPTDDIFCTVYGRTNNVTLSGGAFGTDDEFTANLTSPAVILYHILKSKLGFGEAGINLTSFTDLLTDTGDEAVGFAIPETSNGRFPKYKEVILKLLQTMLVRLFLDDDIKWTAVQIAPLGVADADIDQEEILDNSLSYNFSYKDILSDIIVEYGFAEKSATTTNEKTRQVTKTSDTALYLHDVSKSKTFDSLHFRQADADNLATKISFFYGEREGRLSLSVKNAFFNTLLGDTMSVTRDNLPGSDFKFTVEESQKSLRRVNLVLNDQKGIEDNSESWP